MSEVSITQRLRQRRIRHGAAAYDRSLLLTALALMLIGMLMVSSASVMEAGIHQHDAWFFLKRHALSLLPALLILIICAAVPTTVQERASIAMMLTVIALLIAVLIVGRRINGATRWLNLGIFNLQPGELLKYCWIVYFASYTSRKLDEVRLFMGFIKPLLFIGAISVLLLFQPDTGTLVVTALLTLGILWMAGARLLMYIGALGVIGLCVSIITIISPYRMERISSFLDPWQDEFGSGYQLTQSLMAFGRGGLTGQGLGNSIQKLGYLPEAHTDFIISILGEEFGFVGMCLVIALEFFLICRALALGFRILRRAPLWQGYCACGIALWFCMQTVINIGAASGLLPTKGLTLPFISFGGSSLLVCCAALGTLLRIDFEWRRGLIGPPPVAAELQTGS